MRRIDARALATLAGLLAMFEAGTAHAGNCWVRAEASQRGVYVEPWSDWYPNHQIHGCDDFQPLYNACCEVFPNWIPFFGSPVACLGPEPIWKNNCHGTREYHGQITNDNYGVVQTAVCATPPDDWGFFRRDTA